VCPSFWCVKPFTLYPRSNFLLMGTTFPWNIPLTKLKRPLSTCWLLILVWTSYPSQPLTRGFPSLRTSQSLPFLACSLVSDLSTPCSLEFAYCSSSTTPRSTRCDHMTIFNDTSSNTVCICMTLNFNIVGM